MLHVHAHDHHAMLLNSVVPKTYYSTVVHMLNVGMFNMPYTCTCTCVRVILTWNDINIAVFVLVDVDLGSIRGERDVWLHFLIHKYKT